VFEAVPDIVHAAHCRKAEGVRVLTKLICASSVSSVSSWNARSACSRSQKTRQTAKPAVVSHVGDLVEHPEPVADPLAKKTLSPAPTAA
jgi:hypothetical protein